jgi:uncharacterized membrane protein
MKKDKHNIIENFKAGFNATLPILILIALLSWGIAIVFKLIQPFVVLMAPNPADQTVFVKFAALFLVVLVFVVIGAMVRSQEGKQLFDKVEFKLFAVLPGYSVVKETVLRFIGTKKIPFSRVAMVNIFNNTTRQIAFVTDEHDQGYTVFVPTGPNPTSGNIFILPRENVELIDMPIEQAMKTIVACGIGSKNVMEEKDNKNSTGL